MEVAVLVVIVATALASIVTMQSESMKSGASIKFATLKQTTINNLIESASSTGHIITTAQPNGIDLDTISPGGTLTTPISEYTGVNSGSSFWYKWIIRDVSYRINTSGDLESPGSPILVAPTGTRIFSASLAVYNEDPGNRNLSPTDTFQTTLRTNKGTGLPAVQKPGLQILFDNSDSMFSMVKEDPSLFAIQFLDVPTLYRYPGQPDWSTGQFDPSIPNHSGGTVDPTNAATHEATSIGGWAAQKFKADGAQGIGYCRTAFPHLTYRYQHLNGQGAEDFASVYGLKNSEKLNPFDNARLDLTLQKSYPGAPGNRTYPGPGVLGMPPSNSPGACDTAPSQWGTLANLPITSKFGRWYYMAGTIGGPGNASCNGEGQCMCKPFREWGGTGWSYNGMRYNPGTGQYIDTGLRYQLPATPFAMFDNAPEGNCMFSPMVPPWGPDIRQHFQAICKKNPNDPDFDNFSSTHLSRMEMARNGILKFLINLEQNQLILDNGKIGFRPFNPLGGQEVLLNNGGATNQYVSLHADRPKLFETLRIRLLSINRYGSPGGCLNMYGQTPTYDRLLEAAQELKSNSSLTSRFVIMFTDGIPTNSLGQADPALPGQIQSMIKAQYNDPKKPIQLFNIGISQANAAQMNSWSAQTQSGASFFAGDSKELDAAFVQVSLLIQRNFLLNEIDRYHLGIN